VFFAAEVNDVLRVTLSTGHRAQNKYRWQVIIPRPRVCLSVCLTLSSGCNLL